MNDQSLKNAAIDFLTLASSGKVAEAYERYVGANFRHHNPWFRGDAASLKAGMQQSAAQHPGNELKVQRVLQDGNEVAVLSWVRQHAGDRGVAVVHILRFEGGRIAELWDIIQPIEENPVNENGTF